MGRPRRQYQADDAAKAASEAAKVLQQRSQEVRNTEAPERIPEPKFKSEAPEGWTPPKRNDTHSLAIEEIAASRSANVPQEPEEAAQAKVKEEPRIEPQVEAKKEEPVPELPKTIRVKVDGEEYDEQNEVVESYGGIKPYQIQKAAENRLKKANEALAEIRRAQAELVEQQRIAQLPKEPQVTDEQFIAERMDKIRFGTPEEAAKAQLEILQRVNKPFDQNAIIEQATNRFSHDEAVRRFDQEFQDVATNPYLLRLVVALRNERIPQLKGPVDWTQFYRTIGNEVRGAAGKPTSSTASSSVTSGTPSQQSKEERKAAAVVSLPTTAARAELPREDKPQTRADLIKEMRKKRGLPVD